MATTNAMTGTIATSSLAPTVIVLSPVAALAVLTVNDGNTGSSIGRFRFAVNAESVNVTSNSCAPASGIAMPIKDSAGVGTLTLYTNNGETNQVYTLASCVRFTSGS